MVLLHIYVDKLHPTFFLSFFYIPTQPFHFSHPQKAHLATFPSNQWTRERRFAACNIKIKSYEKSTGLESILEFTHVLTNKTIETCKYILLCQHGPMGIDRTFGWRSSKNASPLRNSEIPVKYFSTCTVFLNCVHSLPNTFRGTTTGAGSAPASNGSSSMMKFYPMRGRLLSKAARMRWCPCTNSKQPELHCVADL